MHRQQPSASRKVPLAVAWADPARMGSEETKLARRWQCRAEIKARRSPRRPAHLRGLRAASPAPGEAHPSLEGPSHHDEMRFFDWNSAQ